MHCAVGRFPVDATSIESGGFWAKKPYSTWSVQETRRMLESPWATSPARPIREAQVRSSQLSSHYDSMSAEKKAAFDASAAKFLAADFGDRVVVSVTFHTDVANYGSLLRNYWATQSLAKLSMTV